MITYFKQSKKTSEQGFILASMMITFTFIIIVGALVTQLIISNFFAASRELYRLNAQLAADAGADAAIIALNNDEAWTGFGTSSTPPPGESECYYSHAGGKTTVVWSTFSSPAQSVRKNGLHLISYNDGTDFHIDDPSIASDTYIVRFHQGGGNPFVEISCTDTTGSGTGEIELINNGDYRSTYEVTVISNSEDLERVLKVTGRTYRDGEVFPEVERSYEIDLRGLQGVSGDFAIVSGVGGLILENTAKILDGDVYVNGSIDLANTAQIGTSSNTVSVGAAHYNCPTSGGSAFPDLCTSGEPISISNSAKIYGEVCANNQTTSTGMLDPGLLALTDPECEAYGSGGTPPPPPPGESECQYSYDSGKTTIIWSSFSSTTQSIRKNGVHLQSYNDGTEIHVDDPAVASDTYLIRFHQGGGDPYIPIVCTDTTGLGSSGDLPFLELPDHDRATQDANVNNTIGAVNCNSNSGMFTWPARTKITGDVSIGKKCKITIEGDIWIEGSLTLSNSAQIIISDSISLGGLNTVNPDIPTIMVDDEDGISLSNKAKIVANSADVGAQLITYWSKASCSPDCSDVTGSDLFDSQDTTTIYLQQSADAPSSILYARWSQVDLNNGGDIGALAGQTIKLRNSATVTFGTSITSGGTAPPKIWLVDNYRRTF